jgi:hypothetical protein
MLKFYPLFLIFCLSALSSFGQNFNCKVGNSKIEIEGNNLRALLLNRGNMFWDPVTQRPGFQFPKLNGSIYAGKHLFLVSSLWIGGKDSASGSFVFSAQTYGQQGVQSQYWPGPILNNPLDSLNEPVCKFWDRHFKVDRASLDSFALAVQTGPLPLASNSIPLQIRNWPGRSNPFLLAQAQIISPKTALSLQQDLAPFVDVDSNGLYEPQMGDYPDLGLRQSMVWWVMNDAGNKKELNGVTDSILKTSKLEFQVLASIYSPSNQNQYLNQSLFLDWKILNKGDMKLKNTFVGLFNDPDLGNSSDDMIGSYPLKNLAYCYNGDSIDEGPRGYGANPPAVGLKILEAPGQIATADGVDNDNDGQTDEPGEKKILFSFIDYFINTNPVTDPTYFFFRIRNHLNGKLGNGGPIYYGKKGIIPVPPHNAQTTFMYPGASDPIGYGAGGTVSNPLTLPPWFDGYVDPGNPNPTLPYGERIFTVSSGPFNFQPGESILYRYAILVGHGGNYLENIDNLVSVSDSLSRLLPFLTSTKTLLPQALEEIRIYPNPTQDDLYLLSQFPLDQIALFDVQGRTVKIENLSESGRILNLKSLLPGVYFLRIAQNGKIIFKKVVKE